MRIGYFHYLWGDDHALLHVQQFAGAARRLGYDISVHGVNLAPCDSDSTTNRARKWVKGRLSRYLHEPKELLWNARYVRRELAIVRAERPDVMLVRDHALTVAEVAVRALTGLPLVLEVNAPATEAATYFNEYKHIPGAGFMTERIKLRSADRILVVSNALRSYLIEAHGLSSEKVVINHNGADCERFHPDIDPAEVCRRHGLGDDLVIGLTASLQSWHGPDFLMSLIEALCRPGVQFLFLGDGPAWKKVREWTVDRGYNSRVKIVGRIAHDEVPFYVAAMDVALVPESAFYQCPLKVLEYMAAGRAIVAPRRAPLQELIEDGEQGLLFPPRDLRAAVECIEAVLADRSTRLRLGRSARRRVVQHLTWGHNARRVAEACSEALDERIVDVRRDRGRPTALRRR